MEATDDRFESLGENFFWWITFESLELEVLKISTKSSPQNFVLILFDKICWLDDSIKWNIF